MALKIVLLGDSGTGKTSIITRYILGSFLNQQEATLGASYFSKELKLEDSIFTLNIWDTAGSENYRSLTPMYYRNADAAIIVFDVTELQTFRNIKSWVEDIKEYTDLNTILLCGNKIDQIEERSVEFIEASEFADFLGLLYCETSAKTGVGIDFLFESILTHLVQSRQIQFHHNKNKSFIESNNENLSKNCC